MVWRHLIPALVALLLTACAGGGAGLDDARRRELDESWRLYQLGDPAWPGLRDRWYAAGGKEREALIFSLIRDLLHRAATPVRTGDALEPGWLRPSRELQALPAEDTVDLLVVFLRSGRDRVSLEALAATLGSFGNAVDPLIDALDHPEEGDSAQFAPFAYRALVQAGGGRAIGRVGKDLADQADWVRRSQAAEALGAPRVTDRERAVTQLLHGLDDGEPFVVGKVLQSLVRIGDARVAPRVALTLEQAAARGDDKVAGFAIQALQRLTRTEVRGDDPALWRAAAERAAAKLPAR